MIVESEKLHVAAIVANDMAIDTASKADHGSCLDLELGTKAAEKLALKFRKK